MGSSLNSEISSAWDAAQEAAERYGDFVTALMSGIESEISSITSQITSLETRISTISSSSSGSNGIASTDSGASTTVGTTSANTSYTEADLAKAKQNAVSDIVARMRALSAQWFSADASTQQQLSNQALQLGASLAAYGISATRDQNGAWHITSDSLNPSNVGKLLYDCYHTGGIVGGDSSLKQNEVMAVLEKGEAVLDEQKEKALYRIIDFTTVLSEKLGKAIGEIPVIGSMFSSRNELTGLQSAALGNVSGAQTIQITENITCAPQDSVEAHQKISRDVMNEIARQIRKP